MPHRASDQVIGRRRCCPFPSPPGEGGEGRSTCLQTRWLASRCEAKRSQRERIHPKGSWRVIWPLRLPRNKAAPPATLNLVKFPRISIILPVPESLGLAVDRRIHPQIIPIRVMRGSGGVVNPGAEGAARPVHRN